MKAKFLFSIVVAVFLVSCSSEITDISLEKEAIALRIGEAQALKASVYPAGASLRDIRWSSSDNGIATVNGRGEVTAIAKGTVEISVTTSDGSQVVTCLVVVVDKPNIVKELVASPTFDISLMLDFSLPGTMVIDWGDGTELDVRINLPRSSGGVEFTRTAATTGAQTIKIYSEDITAISATGSGLWFQFTNLDIRGATNLVELSLIGHLLTDLDLSNNTQLEFLRIWNTPLSSLDVSNNTKLEEIVLSNMTQLTSLNLGNNDAMRFLTSHNSRLWGLDVSGLSNLIGLDLSFNRLTSLDVSGLYNLRSINVPNNRLEAEAFNELFHSLNDTPTLKGVGVAYNPGRNGFDNSIAEDKGWDIFGSVGFGGLR